MEASQRAQLVRNVRSWMGRQHALTDTPLSRLVLGYTTPCLLDNGMCFGMCFVKAGTDVLIL